MSDEILVDITDSTIETLLEDFAEIGRGDFVVSLQLHVDGIGYTALLVSTSEGLLCRAGGTTATEAVSRLHARFVGALEDLTEDSEDAEEYEELDLGDDED